MLNYVVLTRASEDDQLHVLSKSESVVSAILASPFSNEAIQAWKTLASENAEVCIAARYTESMHDFGQAYSATANYATFLSDKLKGVIYPALAGDFYEKKVKRDFARTEDGEAISSFIMSLTRKPKAVEQATFSLGESPF